MNYLVGLTLHSGQPTVTWLRNCQDFWDAVEKSRYLVQPKLPEPPKPVKAPGYDHLFAGELHDWMKTCAAIRRKNDQRVKSVEYIKVWELA